MAKNVGWEAKSNHDGSYKGAEPGGCICVDDAVYVWKGLRIMGLGGSIRYNCEETFQYTEKEMRRRMRRLWFKAHRAGGIDLLWIGARTSANPFAMQELADSLKGVDIPVLIKNPVNPDIELWIGALERINGAGITRLGAIHRGFSSIDQKIYRNAPMWHIPIELHRRFPNLPVICDPSHIGGRRDLIAPLCQQAMDMGFSGLIVESHCNPDCAWSDAKQQVMPDVLDFILDRLVIRENVEMTESLSALRKQIDELDNCLLYTSDAADE